jgi:hypothetical protein
VVDVRHFKGKIDHPIILKKKGTSNSKAVFLSFATGSTTCHTTFHNKKNSRKQCLIVLKWSETWKTGRCYTILRYNINAGQQETCSNDEFFVDNTALDSKNYSCTYSYTGLIFRVSTENYSLAIIENVILQWANKSASGKCMIVTKELGLG